MESQPQNPEFKQYVVDNLMTFTKVNFEKCQQRQIIIKII